MKKIYLILLVVSLCFAGFSQSTIATIDRLNGLGPTATDNVVSVSSIGLTRGAGINQTGSDGIASFRSNNFNISGDLAAAQTSGDYLEWSVKANVAFEIVLEDLDIILRRNDNGPSNFQLFYSLDGFATPGIAIGGVQNLLANTDTSYNMAGIVGSNLGINSGTSGTITFRLYAWGTLANNGNLSVLRQTSWAISPAVSEPGIRIIGTILPPASAVSFDSDIIATTNVPIQQNINYLNFNAPSGLNFFNSVPLGDFTIQDGGGSPDTDTNPTIVESIEFAVTNSENIAALAIFVPGGFSLINIAEVTNVTEFTTFSGLNLVAPDDGSITYVVAATFKSTVTDNDQIQLTINSAITPAAGSSLFAEANAGGAATSTAGDDNRIEVTVSQFQFVQQPTDGNEFEIMLPYPVIQAIDVNLNRDVDANLTGINVTSVPGSSIVNETYNMVNGEAILDQVVFTDSESGISLLASSGSISGTSDPFNINGPLVTIIEQNFDTSIDWSYTATTFGDATAWAAQTGHFNEIALTDAPPLNNIFFDGDIFGENNLEASGDIRRIITLADVDVSGFNDMRIEFDWQVIGYANNVNDLQYRLRLNGAFAGEWQTLFDGSLDSDVNDGQGRAKINIPDGTNTAGLEIRAANRLATGYAGIDNIKIVRTFTGLIYSDAGGWKDNISPDATTGASNVLVIDGIYSLSGNVQVNNIIVQSPAQIVIPTSQSLTVNGNMIVNGNLELNSSSNTYSSLIVNGNTFGEVTYKRHVNQFADTGATTGRNDLIAAPVTNSNQDFLALRTANPDIPEGNIAGVPSFLFGPFDNNTNAYINYTTANDSDPIEPGIGYRTASTVSGGSVFTFKGDVATNASPVAITQGTGNIFNLVGNPYPSYISLSGFLAANITEFAPDFSGVYGYDGEASDGFQIWNQAFSDANPNAIIAPGQGFLVASKTGGGVISFPPSIRAIGTADDFIPGRSIYSEISNLKLRISNGVERYYTDFYFTNNADDGLNPGYDSAVFGEVPEFALFSHLVDNNSGIAFAVQSLGRDALEGGRIPLGINSNSGETFTIEIGKSDLPEDIEVLLEDSLNNTFTRLNDGSITISSSNALNGTGRFFLHLGREALNIGEEQFSSLNIYTIDNPKTLVINGILDGDTQFRLLDIMGRVVRTETLNANSTIFNIDVSSFKTGIYIVQLENESGRRAQKIILK